MERTDEIAFHLLSDLQRSAAEILRDLQRAEARQPTPLHLATPREYHAPHMIDTHCHLTFPDYQGRIDQTLADAREAGVHGAITISTTTRDCLDALAIAQEFDNVWCTAGVHPLYADRGPHDWDSLRRVAEHPKCVAWGELGLDNHYDKPVKPTQLAVLEEELAYIDSCRRGESGPVIDKPIVLHCREAFAELIPILRATKFDPSRFVFHCFTGTPDDMRLLLDFGAMVSFTGVVTYRNAKDVQAAAKLAPLDRIMVETDAPFLTPEPHRRIRPNEPKFVMATARFLAKLRGEDWGAFRGAMETNTERFFGVRAK
ncbi:MAG: TatD family deoxyribonuclease [Phycisphaeraceae bacterium]|nr:MAG: TatD family deoxyribonuclease [Phycisphaeraceae bacterium]